ncbi:glycosyltransferase family 9 protein [Xanthomonadaceae bacterium JHOS43]|nr:glycosyltransferase family 9 protein [Xanthomonadaceae bacterium JHOS43]MCX7564001.1 glycosyltransferase family 9 protein [Xanthomonadaceae bacterium XH05]
MNAPARILVIKLGALGDILLAEGAFRDIRTRHPDARISILTRRPFKSLLVHCPWVDEALVDDNRPRWRLDAMWKLRKLLRARRFDLVYDLQNSRRSAFYLRTLLGNRVPSAGMPPKRLVPPNKHLPVLERHARQLVAAGTPVTHTPHPGADWMVTEVGELLAANGIRPPYVVLLPGSSARGAAKRWPHYAELATRLHERGLMPVTVPGPDELDQFDHLPGVSLRTAEGRALDLFALAGVLRHASAVVGNDSGPTHLAANLNVPGIALFGTDARQAERTRLGRGRMRTLVAPGFDGLDAEAVESELLETLAR